MWGSSLGWLVFYAALTYGVRSRGVELLEVLSFLALLVQKVQLLTLQPAGLVWHRAGDCGELARQRYSVYLL